MVRGPSGSGKSTLLRGLCGLSDVSAGRVTLDGEQAATVGWPQWRAQVSYSGQTPRFSDPTLGAALARPFAYASVPGAFSPEAATRTLQLLGLDAPLDREIDRLSEGELQRLALARQLLPQPRVMLLDEPTSALDSDNTQRVESLLRGFQDEGGIVVVVTHDDAQAERLADAVLDLADYATQRRSA